MGAGDKAKNAADKLKGDAKEKFGDATDNEDLQAEGRIELLDPALGLQVLVVRGVAELLLGIALELVGRVLGLVSGSHQELPSLGKPSALAAVDHVCCGVSYSDVN